MGDRIIGQAEGQRRGGEQISAEEVVGVIRISIFPGRNSSNPIGEIFKVFQSTNHNPTITIVIPTAYNMSSKHSATSRFLLSPGVRETPQSWPLSTSDL